MPIRKFFALFVFLPFFLQACDFSAVSDFFSTGEKKPPPRKLNIATEKPVPPPPVLEDEGKAEVPSDTTEKVFSPMAVAGSAPLEPLEHLGGIPTSLDLDENFLYIGFGRKLELYDHLLNFSGSALLKAPVLKVFPVTEGDGLVIFVKEAGNILEIVKKTGDDCEILKSFRVDGNFDVLDRRLFVYLPDKVQVLDLSRPDDIHVLFELHLKQASQVYPGENFFYVVRGQELNVVEKGSMTVLSSIPVGAGFKILGSLTETETTQLVLALKSPATGKTETIRFMPLVPGGGGVADMGHGVKLSPAVDNITSDDTEPYFYLLRDGVLSVFDLKTKTEIRGAKGRGPVRFAFGKGGFLFTAGEGEIASLGLKITPAEPSKDQPPLAQAEASAGGGLVLEERKVLPLAGNITAVMLNGDGSMLAVNRPAPKASAFSTLFYMTTLFDGKPRLLAPLENKAGAIPAPFDISIVRFSGLGVFLYGAKEGKIYLVKNDFSGIEPLILASAPVSGMDVASTSPTQNYLYLGISKKEFSAYSFESPKVIKKLGSLPLAGIGGLRVFAGNTKALVACGPAGACIVDIALKPPVPLKLASKIAPAKEGAIATEVVVSPDEKTGYVFYEHSGGSYISVIDLKRFLPAEISRIEGTNLSSAQFCGMTFTAGGQKVILPQEEGIVVYDAANPANPHVALRWPVGKALFADVTNRGKILCAALGDKGVECGQFAAESPPPPPPPPPQVQPEAGPQQNPASPPANP